MNTSNIYQKKVSTLLKKSNEKKKLLVSCSIENVGRETAAYFLTLFIK